MIAVGGVGGVLGNGAKRVHRRHPVINKLVSSIKKTHKHQTGLEPCDKLRALRLSSAEFQRKFCPLFLSAVGAGIVKPQIQEEEPTTPWINTLVSQASQVEEKCFRSKRPNFASKNAFSPSAALRAAACKARVALGRVRQEKSQNKSPEATPRGFVLAPPVGLEPTTP